MVHSWVENVTLVTVIIGILFGPYVFAFGVWLVQLRHERKMAEIAASARKDSNHE